MIRSLVAMIIAILTGLTTAKFIEGAGMTVIGGPDGVAASYQAVLVISWGIGAFAAALVAMIIGGRWAPLGGLAAGTVFFSAIIVQVSAPIGWLALPGAALATGLGGFAAIKALGASVKPPMKKNKLELFDD